MTTTALATDVDHGGRCICPQCIGLPTRAVLDAMRTAARITVEAHAYTYHRHPEWNETICLVWQDGRLKEGFKNEARAEQFADELAMELVEQELI